MNSLHSLKIVRVGWLLLLETERIKANSHMISGESLPIIGPQAPQRHKSHFVDSTQFKKIFFILLF